MTSKPVAKCLRASLPAFLILKCSGSLLLRLFNTLEALLHSLLSKPVAKHGDDAPLVRAKHNSLLL
jgi:hypothetical protein